MSLKSYRIKEGLTQDKLSKILDMNLRTVQNIEKSNNTSLKTAREISLKLGKPIEEIFFNESKS